MTRHYIEVDNELYISIYTDSDIYFEYKFANLPIDSDLPIISIDYANPIGIAKIIEYDLEFIILGEVDELFILIGAWIKTNNKHYYIFCDVKSNYEYTKYYTRDNLYFIDNL